MKKALFLLIFFCCFQNNIFSQSSYSLNPEKDTLIGFISLSAGIMPFFINFTPETAPDILNENNINSFDRFFLSSYKHIPDLVSDYSAYGLAFFPLISIITNISDTKDIITYAVMYSEALLLSYGTTFSLKGLILRNRPYMYSHGIPEGKENDYFNSFPSGAATFAFLGATFFSVTFYQDYPESKWGLPLIITSYSLATAIAATRVASGAHFVTDALAGAAIGSLYGWLIPWLHLKNNNKKFEIIPAGNGIAFKMNF
ncbi:MAG: phosphatase PAP2 family protein [Treponema sp.]|jgi:membrane-associated phospholipid phosphatase|nr:phosphatase PAP2 family protein [Treponema sp.]